MTGKIFKGIFFVSLITLLACLVFVIGVQYQLYSENQFDELKNTAVCMTAGISAAGDHYLDDLSDFKERITLIGADGTVLFDNRSDPASMENHAGRAEVKAALSDGSGQSVRYSRTLSKKTCYYAVRLDDGRVLRVSSEHAGIMSVLLQLLQPIAAVAVLSVLLSAGLASLIAGKILKPINAIDLDSPVVEESYAELAPLVDKINAQNRRIRRQIEKLTQSRREFEVIADNMSEGLLLTDRDGNILTHNKSIDGFFGSGTAQDGQNLLTLNRSESFRLITDALRAGRHESAVTTLHGRSCEVIANPVFDEEKALCGGIVLILDVTEKENREQLRQEFTANVSHELKTPLTSIYGLSDLLKNGLVKPEDVAGFGDDINRESGRLIALVGDIIKLSRLDEGNPGDLTERTDLQTIAGEVCGRLHAAAEQQGVTLGQSGTAAPVTGSAALLSEMISNLCDNAIKYNRENGSVTVTTGVRDGRSFVTVADTGIGIDKADTDRVFERFYRVDKSRSKESGGTGLGLSIVKHIAACHRAEIRLESETGKGTRITVTFPPEQPAEG